MTDKTIAMTLDQQRRLLWLALRNADDYVDVLLRDKEFTGVTVHVAREVLAGWFHDIQWCKEFGFLVPSIELWLDKKARLSVQEDLLVSDGPMTKTR